MILRTVSVSLLLACASSMALAQPGPRGGPPQAAIDACTGVSLEQACRFEGRRGEVNGTCREVRDGSVACVPDNAPEHRQGRGRGAAYGAGGSQSRHGGGRRGPPPEAYTACEGLSDGGACSVETPHGTLSGTCRVPRRGSQQETRLICAPEGGPPR